MSKKNIVTLTNNAIKKLGDIALKNKTNSILLYVKSGGCNGFTYEFSPIADSHKKNNKDDDIINYNTFDLYICKYSTFKIIGTEIDWKSNIMGEYFHFDNPNATSKCGCGTSFTAG